MVNETVMRFMLRSTDDFTALMSRFYPRGIATVNRTEWRGLPPRSCGLTKVAVRPFRGTEAQEKIIDIEVTHRPKGCITYIGNTRYDGWTAMVLDKRSDGTLLDGNGNPLPAGHDPVFLPFKTFDEVDFNELDFGVLISQSSPQRIEVLQYSDAIQLFDGRTQVTASIGSTFIAPRRRRPEVKIILSNATSGKLSRDSTTTLLNVNKSAPHLDQVIADELAEALAGFIEGRYSINNVRTDEIVFVDLTGIVIDCTPNELGGDSLFDILREYVSDEALEDLANRLQATYEIAVSVVTGDRVGLLLRRVESKDSW